jgi:AcrR family transcriptional regulator
MEETAAVADEEEREADTPVERWTPERRRARTRAALVDAARYVFARKGFEGASLDQIAETAGYTRGAIYKHFDGKEDLLFAVYDQINEEALQRYASLLELDPASALDPGVIVETWRDLFAGDTDIRTLELEFQLYALRHPSVAERSAAHRERNLQLIAEFMRVHSKAGGFQITLPIETVTAMLLITADAFARASQTDPGAVDLYRQFLELFLPVVIRTE